MNEFSVYDYLSRIEDASLEIEKNQKPVDTVIVLWWGLDGLRLNENGTTEWIRRRKTEPKLDPLLQMAQQISKQQMDEYIIQMINASLQSRTVQPLCGIYGMQ